MMRQSIRSDVDDLSGALPDCQSCSDGASVMFYAQALCSSCFLRASERIAGQPGFHEWIQTLPSGVRFNIVKAIIKGAEV